MPTSDRTASLDPKMAAIMALRRPVPPDASIEARRRINLEDKAQVNGAARALVSVEDRTVRGAAGERWLRVVRAPGSPAAAPPIVAIHGGGWALCDPESHLALFAGLALASRRAVYAPHPRQAPEHRYPAPVEDVTESLVAIAEEVGAPVAVFGDSAGAHLALSAALRLREAGAIGLVSCLVLAVGCYRRAFDTPTHALYGNGEFGLTSEAMRWFWDAFDPTVAGGADLTGARLAGLPPIDLHAAECDPLLDDTLWLAGRLSEGTSAHRLSVWPGVVHGFLHYFEELPQARGAFAGAAEFVAAHGSVSPADTFG